MFWDLEILLFFNKLSHMILTSINDYTWISILLITILFAWWYFSSFIIISTFFCLPSATIRNTISFSLAYLYIYAFLLVSSTWLRDSYITQLVINHHFLDFDVQIATHFVQRNSNQLHFGKFCTAFLMSVFFFLFMFPGALWGEGHGFIHLCIPTVWQNGWIVAVINTCSTDKGLQ